MQFNVVDRNTPMPNLLDPKLGVLKLLPTAAYDAFDRDGVRLWCHQHARYGLPTVELIAHLKEVIGGRPAIEIGAGSGDLCGHLGIPGTDSYVQTDNQEAARYYALTRQPPIRYGAWVHKMEALDAIDHFKPEVVVASWVTHWVDPAITHSADTVGCMFGVREDLLLQRGVTYVMIGNQAVHAAKPILARPHVEYWRPFLRSRASKPEADRIFIWSPA